MLFRRIAQAPEVFDDQQLLAVLAGGPVPGEQNQLLDPYGAQAADGLGNSLHRPVAAQMIYLGVVAAAGGNAQAVVGGELRHTLQIGAVGIELNGVIADLRRGGYAVIEVQLLQNRAETDGEFHGTRSSSSVLSSNQSNSAHFCLA